MKDFTKYAMGIVTGISVAVALGAAGNSGQQDEPRSSSRVKRAAVERQGDQSCPVIEGAWGAPRLLEGACELPYYGGLPYNGPLSGPNSAERILAERFYPDQGTSLGLYGRSIAYLSEATGEFTYETPLYAIDESLVIPFFNPDSPYPGGTAYIGFLQDSLGLFDVDGDGVKDLVGRFLWLGDGSGSTPLLWLKNLAFPVPGDESSEPRLPGDLNGDCEVSGADLGLLLTEYGNVCP